MVIKIVTIKKMVGIESIFFIFNYEVNASKKWGEWLKYSLWYMPKYGSFYLRYEYIFEWKYVKIESRVLRME